MIDKGMDNEAEMLQGLIDIANKRIAEIKSGENPALAPDNNAKYFAEVVIDLDKIDEPMIADPDVENIDPSKRYTHDTIRPISHYNAEKKVDLGFVGSCMVHKGDMKIVAQMFRNLEKIHGKVEFKAPLVVAPPTYNIVDELKEEGDWRSCRSTPASSSTTAHQRRTHVRSTTTSCTWNARAAISAWVTKRRRKRATRSWPRPRVSSRAGSWKIRTTRKGNPSSRQRRS